jgi:uncharacterized membrane protein
MNSSQIHLALTHVPVIFSITGVIVLAVSLLQKNYTAARMSFYLLIAAGLFALPVFFTGEGAEENIEHIAGVSESIIEKHESLANISLWIIIATALLALIGLLRLAGRQLFQIMRFLVLTFAFLSAGFMGYTAHLGGQIRHSEIRSGMNAGSLNDNAVNENGKAPLNEAENDD